ncbi:MAG: AmmeMemoRadiSam system radical SAM enzyme [Methanomassiliicoccales archaeon]
MKEARFWERSGEKVVCHLCPHECTIPPGRRGICGVRENREGTLMSLIYGKVSSVNVDPIEKKPLFHFRPGETALSLGTIGCNFRCEHCQNFTISQAEFQEAHLSELTPEGVVEMCRREGCGIVAWTYNEPSIWHEFTYDSARATQKEGISNVYVTNGYLKEDPLRELSPFLDAMNIDVKAFREDFYRKVCRASLQPVLDTAELARELGILIELTYLIIPGQNDSREEIGEFCRWVADLDPGVPVHFTRFHPDYRMRDGVPTPMETMERAWEVGREVGLEYVYLGNVPMSDRENTYCPHCGAMVIRRTGFRSRPVGLSEGRCTGCGRALNIVQ